MQVRQLHILASKLPDLEAPARPRAGADAPRRSPRLSTEQARQVVTEYQAGATVYELSATFKVNRKTVSNILHRAGVQIRGRLTAAQVDEAEQLYVAGWSLARIGDKLSVDSTTVWNRLRERGVRMRDTQGRDR